MEIAREALLVISLPSSPREVSGLSAAELAVALAAARGLSNLGIARQRRRSQRTIANQLASAFRKLGVSSRSELSARFARAHAG